MNVFIPRIYFIMEQPGQNPPKKAMPQPLFTKVRKNSKIKESIGPVTEKGTKPQEVEGMKINRKKALIYGGLLLNYYLLPLLMIDTGSGMFILLLVMPALTLGLSYVYGRNFGFNLVYSVLVAILFLPTIWIHYNGSAMIYLFINGILALLGQALGKIGAGRG